MAGAMILVVEDEPLISSFIEKGLRAEGFGAVGARATTRSTVWATCTPSSCCST